jgi:phosphoribosylaminoimidazole (AIR) synthetase
MASSRYRDGEGGFALDLPEGWVAERDGEGGILVSAEDGVGLLHLVAFDGDPATDADPAEELYAFLAEQEIELEEDEVEDVELAGEASLALCEYLATNEEDEEEIVFWMVGVATAAGRLVFASYSCVSGEEAAERETVRSILASLELEPGGG